MGGPSRIDSNGQFALVPIRAEEIVVVWSGPVVSNAELRRIAAEGKYHSSAAIGDDRNILFEVIDPSAPPARWLHHETAAVPAG